VHERVEELRHETQEHRESLALDALTGEPVVYGNRTAPVVSPDRPLAGSILSTQTWSQAWTALRERRQRNP